MFLKLGPQFFIIIIIISSFTMDFGLSISGNRVYLPFLFTIVATPIFLLKNFKIEIKILKATLPLLLLLCCAILSVHDCLFSPIEEFKGEKIGVASFKALVYLIADVAIVFLVVQFFKQNQNRIIFNIVRVMTLLTVVYGSIEFANILIYMSDPQSPLSIVMAFFHAGKWGLQSNYLSLLGCEHSYGIISSSILYGFFIASLLCRNTIFGNRVIDFMLAIVMLILSIMTDSKGGYIMLLLMHLVIIFVIIKDRSIKKIVLIPISIGILIFSIVWGTIVISRANQIVKKDVSSTYTRNTFLLAGIDMIKRFPVTGIGISNYKFYYSESLDKLKIPKIMEVKDFADTNIPTSMPDAGNMFVGIFCELGIVGFFIFMWFLTGLFRKILWLVKNTRNNQDRAIAYSLLFSYFSIIGSFFHKYLFNIYIWWIVFGLIINIYLREKKKLTTG